MNTRVPFYLLCWAALTTSGCGGVGEISGVVKYQGQPLPAGTITFFDEGRGAWSSPIEPNGSYAIRDVPTGTARITVAAPLPIALPGMPLPKTFPLPAKYAGLETSGVTYQVRSGPQTHDVLLE